MASTDTMTFAFATPVGAVGGFLNYVPGGSEPRPPSRSWIRRVIPIESFDLTFLTGGGNDTGFFYGFQESTANISYFTLTDNYVGSPTSRSVRPVRFLNPAHCCSSAPVYWV